MCGIGWHWEAGPSLACQSYRETEPSLAQAYGVGPVGHLAMPGALRRQHGNPWFRGGNQPRNVGRRLEEFSSWPQTKCQGGK